VLSRSDVASHPRAIMSASAVFPEPRGPMHHSAGGSALDSALPALARNHVASDCHYSNYNAHAAEGIAAASACCCSYLDWFEVPAGVPHSVEIVGDKPGRALVHYVRRAGQADRHLAIGASMHLARVIVAAMFPPGWPEP
jgi:hypothetical protein